MEASDSGEEIVDINEAQTNSKTIDKKENNSKSSLKKVRLSKTKFSIESISQMVKSENDQSFYENEPENEKDNYNNEDEKELEQNIENKEDNNDKDIKDINESKASNTSFIYTFTWEEGGNNVKLIGTFSNWKDTYDMKKDMQDNIHKVSIPLNNEIYYYKFIVDGEWKYAKNQQIKEDNDGNINNILDLTNFFFNFNSDPHNNNIIGKPFNLNNESKQDKLGNPKYYDFEERNFYSSYKSYLGISGYRHNILQHILLPKNFENSFDIKIGLSHRYREKATTIIYYNCSSKIKN